MATARPTPRTTKSAEPLSAALLMRAKAELVILQFLSIDAPGERGAVRSGHCLDTLHLSGVKMIFTPFK